MDRLEVRVSLTKVLLVLIVVIVPLSIVGLVLTESSGRSLDNAIGNDFKSIAQLHSNQVSQYVRDRVADVIVLASNPVIVSAASGHGGAGASPVKTNAAAESGAGLLNSNASQLLRLRRTQDPRFLAFTLTDQNGNVVAASQQPLKMSYAQDPTWQAVYNNGQPKPKVSDIVAEGSTNQDYVNMGVPVTDPASGQTLGILTAAANISPVLNAFNASVGNGARAELVNEDGTIISAPNTDVFARSKSQAFDGLRDAVGTLQPTQSGAQKADLRNGPYLVGFAGTGLKQLSDNLGWFVVVSEEEHQAAAPIRLLVRFALVMVVLALFMLTLLCVYYYLHRTQRFGYIDEEALPPDQTANTGTRTAAASR